MQQYSGHWEGDKREGWGVCILKSGDKFSGSYRHDKMHGRGKYWFYDSPRAVLYVGEIQENIF